MKVIVIDDMKIAREALIGDIRNIAPDLQIVGEAGSVLEGCKLVKKTSPDLIFLDIHLEDGDGFDLLEICNPSCPVIFTTASDAHAIKAFRFSALDYLLKPIDPDQLASAINKARNEPTLLPAISTVKENLSKLSKLVLHTAEEIKVVELKNLVRLESMGNYTYFYLRNGEKMLITKTLKEYASLLESSGFLRVHQSHLINLQHLSAYIKTEGGYLLMKDDAHIPVSVRKKSMVMEAIQNFGNS